LSPFFKGGISPWDINPSLEKRRRGDFSDGMTPELYIELLGHDTRLHITAPEGK
jgi:hypothetical protein